MAQKVSRTREIEIEQINPFAKYNKNMSGIAEVVRLDKAIDIRAGSLSIAKTIEAEEEFTYSGIVSRVTLEHGLGYRPNILGTVKLKSIDNIRIIGDIPDASPTFVGNGKLWIDDVTPSQVTIAWRIEQGSGTEILIIKLFLLTSASI